MRVILAFLSLILGACLVSAHLLRPDKMDLGVYNPETKHYEKVLGEDGHDQQPHGHRKHLLGQDGHDQQPHGHHKHTLGQDGHDQQPHARPLLGGDDHDLQPHGHAQHILGQDGHDQQPHGHHKHTLGQDGHDQQPHARPLLGQDGHDQQPHGHHKAKLGGDGHDQQPHGHSQHILGQDGHDQQPHARPLFGQDGHDQQPHGHHKAKLGGDGHDQQPHGHSQHVLGRDGHDQRPHGHAKKHPKHNKHKGKKHLLGRGDHDYRNHGQSSEWDGKDLTHEGAFKAFLLRNNKTYENQVDYHHRLAIFRQNMHKVKILQHTEQGTATYGASKFADLAEAEFRKMLGFRPDLKPTHSNMLTVEEIPNGPLPTSFDWREQGIVTPVKNQGMCGSCWAFSTTGNVEGQWAIKHKKLFSLSEQELVDCDTEDEGCNGGLPENAYDAIMKLGGLETESDYPYDGQDEECHFNSTLARVTVNGSVELPQNEKALAAWLLHNGPISIGINANALQFYMGGVSHPLKFLCNPADLDHGMLIVGFGVHTTKYLHRRQPYWLVKNSWGEDWGEEGYYRVYRGDGTCGVNKMATSAIVP